MAPELIIKMRMLHTHCIYLICAANMQCKCCRADDAIEPRTFGRIRLGKLTSKRRVHIEIGLAITIIFSRDLHEWVNWP